MVRKYCAIVRPGLLPILLLGFLTIIITLTMVKGALVQEVEESLRGTAYATLAAYEQNSGMDVTFFYGDKRVMSSVIDENGVRALGSPAGEKIVQKVLQNGEEYFSGGVSLNGKLNYGYYVPIYQKAGEPPVGMVFAGTDKAQKDQAVNRIVYTVVIAAAVVMAFCILFMIVFSQSLTTSLHKSVQLVQSVAKGDLGVEPDKKLLARKDEIGDLSKALGSLRNELRNILGHISDASSQSIEKIIMILMENSDEAVTAMQHVQEIIGSQSESLKDTEAIVAEVSKGIGKSMQGIRQIDGSTKLLQDEREEIIETVKGLTEIAERNAVNTEKTSTITNEVTGNFEMVEESAQQLKEIAGQLEECVRYFQL